MMAGSILGPGTIFLMLVGAFVSAFKIGNMVSFEYNIIPVFIFILTCSFCSAKIQLFMAMIISTVYGLVMMAVVVGIALQIKEDGPLAPASMFFFVFAGELIIAGLLHPREINCLPAMLIYYITVPSMYMLLILYSLFNMNNISWGTREAPVTPGADKTKKTWRRKDVPHSSKLSRQTPYRDTLRTTLTKLGTDVPVVIAVAGNLTVTTSYSRPAARNGRRHTYFNDNKISDFRPIDHRGQRWNLTQTDKGLSHRTSKLNRKRKIRADTKQATKKPINPSNKFDALKRAENEEIEEEKKKAEEEAKLKKKKKPFFGFLQGNNKSPEEEGSIEFSLAGLFKCMLCTHPKSVDDKLQLARIAESINSIGRRIEMIERRIDPTVPSRRRGSMSINGHTVSLQEEPEEEDSYSDSIEDMGDSKIARDDLINPFWILALEVKGPTDFLADNEVVFWKDLIEEYLFPIDENPQEKKKLEKGLREMRNKYVFAFIMLNSLFVLAIFLLQLNQDQMHISWPLGAKSSISFNSTSNEACTHFTLSFSYF
uniref:Chitin synthase 1 n=1 Tax=Timema shepardi TaxID=629360 RepID=A0A7R9B6Z0_TIMSH|nr:unnamed protein product [Timema shepardi]